VVKWEREAILASVKGGERLFKNAMTLATTATERVAIRRVEAVLVENRQMFDHVAALGHQRVIVAPPGVDTNRFRPSQRTGQKPGYILSVCRFGDPRKGLSRIIDAYDIVTRSDPNAPPLMLAGRGTVDSSIVDDIRHRMLENRVLLRPNVAASELPGLYQGAAVFVQASYEEGLGLSLLEAMASGLPVVTTETAGSQETVVNGVTGWSVRQDPPGAVPASLAAKIRETLRPDCTHMGLQGRKRCVERFSTDVTLRRFTDVYTDIVSRRPSPISLAR
jgi:glycosyltransferase involved in cell wall biosynthesis